jgi:hypothetical protein
MEHKVGRGGRAVYSYKAKPYSACSSGLFLTTYILKFQRTLKESLRKFYSYYEVFKTGSQAWSSSVIHG